MAQADHREFAQVLPNFEKALEAASVPWLNRLRPPLPASERQSLLQRFTTEQNPEVPVALTALYAWHDGVEPPVYRRESTFIDPWRFLPLHVLVDFYEQTWLPSWATMADLVGADIPEIEWQRHWLPVFPSDADGDSAIAVPPIRGEWGGAIRPLGYGDGLEHERRGPMSMLALLEIWTSWLDQGALRWNDNDELFAEGYEPLHWTTYRSGLL